MLRRWVPAASLPGRGSSMGGGARLPQCARGVGCARARGATPRAARGHWGLVRLFLSPGAARLQSSSSRYQRALTGVTRPPPMAPSRLLWHHPAFLATGSRVAATQVAAAQPTGTRPSWAVSLDFPMPPHLHTITSRHRLAPPARAARSRRPLAPPVCAARSRRPLTPSAHAAASLHRHQALMGHGKSRPPNTVPSAHHHFAPPSRAARSRRPLAPSTRAARSRRRRTAPSAHHHFAPPSRAARSQRWSSLAELLLPASSLTRNSRNRDLRSLVP